ncbi:hypothetical protein LSCM1_00778 [Leishmania martiniquensis]|uniref:Uncharacterized protein n=1 Tax=Leishmania martiniquensis TaxID=1580590 RepID=A0A836KI92_9TRYP|nr:hypothetical protein LSCM1_00778 [Leishmania martiniquensis]
MPSALEDAGPPSMDDASAMWDQIQRMPFRQLQEASDFVYIRKVMTLVTRYVFLESDPNMCDPQYTMSIAKLLKTVSAKCLTEFEHLSQKAEATAAEISNLRTALKVQLSSKEEEIGKLHDLLHNASEEGTSQNVAVGLPNAAELGRLRTENDELSLQVRSLTRRNEELKQVLASRNEEKIHINESYDKAQLEYRHLASKYKRLTDRFAKTEDILEELRRKERGTMQSTHDELDRLRQKVESLQQENFALVQSRDRAEDLCEKREAEALRDMMELRRLTKDLVDEERAKNQSLRDEFVSMKQEANAHVEQLMHQHEADLREKKEEIALLRRQLEKATAQQNSHFERDSSISAASSLASSSATYDAPDASNMDAKVRAVPSEEQRRLERENDDLHAEVEQLELRIDALDEENRRLTLLVKNYENGNEGLYRLRQDLADHTRTVEVLQAENAQLRERLNGMEDSVTFNAALRALCKRVGVTEEEINSLRPQNAASYSEMDTLKEELSLLKEEVEWLERERRHWMNKVRLQPLMDTKLRFELGLSSEQLRQLDKLVDQMKAGAVIVEDNDESYKDKYFKELQARRRDAEQFNTFVKDRINDALKNAFVDVSAPDTAAAVSALREHIDVITSSSTTEAGAQAQEKIERLTSRLEELEQSESVRVEEIARLREQVVASTAEKEVICRERDQYRDAIFGAAGIGAAQAEAGACTGARALGDVGESHTWSTSNAKWLRVADTLREQLRVKDTLIDSLSKELAVAREKLETSRASDAEQHRKAELEKKADASFQDQIKALTELNEELTERCGALTKTNRDLEDALERLDRGTTKELLLKVVLLRRREATLLQRLRRALTTQEESTAAVRRVESQVKNTLERLREVLEGTGPMADAVLPRSSAGCSMEGEMLSFLDYAVRHLLQGRMFREDSRFLLHLRQVYQGMEANQEALELRLDAKRLRHELTEKQAEMDELSAEVAGLRAAAAAAAEGAKVNQSAEYTAAALAKSEAEAATYKQKYSLAVKRLETREKEVAQLESDIDTARLEAIEVRDHIRNILSESADPQMTPSASPPRAKVSATELARLEKEVARLKTVNLGLLHHTMDLQSQTKSLEIELEAKQQEIALLKSSADSQVVTSFVSAAIREHAALRRQSELALIQAKRLKMQLAATEANYHVVSNEATVYKMGAYRLYRKYVEQVVSVVDYLRCVQRSSKGSLSPHQAEIMDRRFRKAVSDLSECFGRGKILAMQLSDAQNTVTTLEHQLSLLQMEDDHAKRDVIDARLQEARSRAREHDRLMTECQEEKQFLQAKLNRAEATNKDLNAEVARLEFGCMIVPPLDAELLATLMQLKESVFDKAVAPSLTIKSPLPAASSELGAGGAEDSDLAIREYKNTVMRQAELQQQCATLERKVADVDAEHRRAENVVAQLREEVQQAWERAAFLQRQLEEERQKGSQREARLLRAHETQLEVARRATEHNVQCLQEMVQKKEQLISSLQEQLSAERRKGVEHGLDEAVRLERLHEHMFRENTAMVERFKSAIETIGDSVQHATDGTALHLTLGASSGVQEQVQALTAETVRLRRELKEARATSIVLESQLEQQVQQQLSAHALPTSAAATPEHSTDALMSIIRNQTAMVESLRQREMQLTAELQREKEQRGAMERQLSDAQVQNAEQGGMLQLLSQVTSACGVPDAPLVCELRAQNAALDQELRVLRQTLEEERAHARRFQMDAAEWKAHLDALQAELSAQQVEVERAQHLAALNEGLRTDLNTVKEQNDKLMVAATILKQKLMDEAHRSGESARLHQQEIALAQRMGTIQQESASHMKVLDHRIRAIQKELNERVEKEKAMLEKNTESQRLVYQLHQQLRAKDRELASLQEQLRQCKSNLPVRSQECSSAAAPGLQSRGTQVLSTREDPPPQGGKENTIGGIEAAVVADAPATSRPPPPASTGHAPASASAAARSMLTPISSHDALLQPQIAGIVQREAQKQQRDNLAQISMLRSRIRRLEKDATEAEEQLKGEREASRHLRMQLRQLREEQDRKDVEHAAQLKSMYHQRVSTEALLSARPAAGETPTSVAPAPLAGEDKRVGMHDTEWALREQVSALESRVRRYEQELDEVKGARTAAASAVNPAHLPSPANVREHVEEVRRLEGVIDSLRRRLAVDVPARERELQQRLEHARSVQHLMATDLASLRGIPVSEVESIYGAAFTRTQQTTDELKMELLRKSNELLDLRFIVETLELQLSRAQRHLGDVLAADAAAGHQQQAHVAEGPGAETLTNVIDNLKLVIAKLQSENAELRSAQAQSARYARQSRELRELQKRERSLQAQLQDLSRQLVSMRASSRGDGGSSESNAELHRRLATERAAVEQYEAELNSLRLRLSNADRRVVRPLDPACDATEAKTVTPAAHSTVPPPLPISRFSHQEQHRGTEMRSLAEPPQRRLSSARSSEADPTIADQTAPPRLRHRDEL